MTVRTYSTSLLSIGEVLFLIDISLLIIYNYVNKLTVVRKMTNNQKKEWLELFNRFYAVAEFEPWEYIPEDVPLFCKYKDEDKYMVFLILGHDSYTDGVVCFRTYYDYLYSMERDKRNNDNPFLITENSLVGLWLNEDELQNDDIALINSLKLNFTEDSELPKFLSNMERRAPMALNREEVKFLTDALGHLFMMLKANEKFNIDFEGGQTMQRLYAGDGIWHNMLGMPEYPLGTRNGIPLKRLEDDIIDDIKHLQPSNLVVELNERCLDMPQMDEESGQMCVPLLVTALEPKSELILFSNAFAHQYDRESSLGSAIVDICMRYGRIKEIRVDNPFTEAAVYDFCTKTGIKLVLRKTPLKKVIFGYMPDELLKDYSMNKQESPASKSGNVIKIYPDRPDRAYIISVSLGKGCYRHIKIPCSHTLEDLHSAILNAFGFDDDHLHAFFMDNRMWSENGYFSRYSEDEEFYSSDYTIAQTLAEKQQFKYVFDFGDSREFSCRVLRIIDETCDHAEVIRSVGEAPAQYPDYEY